MSRGGEPRIVVAADMLIEAYETLRAEGGSGRRAPEPGWGRALVIRRGVAAWWAAWSRVSPLPHTSRPTRRFGTAESVTTSPGPKENRPLVLPALRGDAVAVLAGMALAHGRR